MPSATSNDTPSGSKRELPAQIQRLVDWNTEILYRLLQQVVEKRMASGKSTWTTNEPQLTPSNSILEEVADVIDIPGFTQAPRGSNLNHHSKQNRRSSISALVEDEDYEDPDQQHLASTQASDATGLEAARQQLKEFVTAVANAYHQNPFHCLQHSTAVTTHLTKLLSRIVVDDPIDDDDVPTPPSNSGNGGGGGGDLSLEQAAAAAVNHLKSIGSSDEDDDDGIVDDEDGQDPLDPQDVLDDIAPYLHNHSYGITSDPLTQFALIFSALVGYVDHTGVPNASIAKEEPELAARYQGRSIVEQRSVEKAWKKLMEPSFVELRRCIYADATELERFRQVVVNSVLSIDVADDELQQMRRARWEQTFQQEMTTTPTIRDVNRKATIVLEHLMQASDVFHTMQPWIVYEKWSGKDFQEKYNAFCHGRSDDDPRGTWYSNEMEMFDNYIIPLAMQLKDCDAFVVSSDEYLIYALKNRQKLAAKKDLVDTFLAKIEAASGGTSGSANGTEGQGHPINFFARQELFSGPSKSMEESEESKAARQLQRLIDWNVEMLKRLLKQLVARRRAAVAAGMVLPEANDKDIITKETRVSISPSILDEVYQTPMDFPDFDPALSLDTVDPDAIDIGKAAEKQLRQYVTDVSSRFKKNDFHGLEHESQVCMSARKLLSRISSLVIPPGATVPPAHLGENAMGLVEPNASELHDRTFGFSSDPLAQFALVFASLILDCDHQGVSNAQLARENHPLAIQYNNKSISQQHSLEMTWAHLMMPEFADLRRCIYGYDGVELKRFRQLVVRCMLATDLETEELALFRRKQWDLLFGAPTSQTSADASTGKEKYNQRAMLVLEVLMQTSYLFHANQNWQLYHKWNDRLFTETYKAYRLGRIPQDPSVMWYKSELLFFDEHVIPIAKRINDCGIFLTFGGNGNTQSPSGGGTEYLSFALSNRQQWAAKGGDLIASMMARYHGKEIERNRTRRSYRRTSLTATAKSA
eukprot:Nitzschia sp. Nitz4//scaffold47_size129522//97083//100216//NITZ4_003565-RA/size129522-processed-gene-0.173-mRNA-1//-1//CDS//3329552842//6911//frame0